MPYSEAYSRWKAEGRCVNCGGTRNRALKCERCNEIAKRSANAYSERVRDAAFNAYGGYVCVCCGEAEPKFLTIDHIDGGGNAHRMSTTSTMYVWLKQNNYPKGFQVLCANCNQGRWRNGGTCPHEANRNG